MSRFLPYPFLSGAIVFMWVILSGFSLSQLLLGMMVALFSGWMMQLLEPEKITIKNWRAVFQLIYRVFIDSIVGNISVAWFTLKNGHKKQQSGFVVVPLFIKNHTALAILACILSATPGTVWISYNSKKNELLIHVLNLKDGNDYQQLIKQRYEGLILEIFS
ncbi:Na+/H+ antiporter subunit E [Bartonella bacilliformis]|uniref:Na+/H+ antiporter subunit E n=1 Tax=Bartonella bacilliformis Ver097 TaxID=1293911 RepID=A0A072R5S4_BARBA|nr:Na+/H+ antiporter subunit E [Bartonella bacilliformis]KEG21298.1 hypothetical protein H710_00246 [Bartonella bacilliformis Ver097]